ncbi:MAG TPA: hypothetical protein VE573_14625 [Nitrososphaeraceae archaeon]|nr:hypothetical protein [Nitrososphaeraceae archaeon]
MKTKTWLLVIIFAISIISIVVGIYYSSLRQPPDEGKDLFGIDEIYPTKEGGREWFIDMGNPFSDDIFSSTFDRQLTQQEDGSWRIGGPAVRLNVNTPSNTEPWKNVEITGYAKVIESTSLAPLSNSDTFDDSSSSGEGEEQDFTSDLDWRARGGRHNNEQPCDGTSYTGTIDIDGNVRWKKEIWHTGGYTDERAVEKVTDSIIGRWIGWKVIMYNIDNNSVVKLESYIDDKNNNEWRKVTDLIDDGRWYANSSDEEFYSVDCGRPKDHIITNGGQIVTFRSDNMIWDFKNLSVREINPT